MWQHCWVRGNEGLQLAIKLHLLLCNLIYWENKYQGVSKYKFKAENIIFPPASMESKHHYLRCYVTSFTTLPHTPKLCSPVKCTLRYGVEFPSPTWREFTYKKNSRMPGRAQHPRELQRSPHKQKTLTLT